MQDPVAALLGEVFARYDAKAMGGALGLILGSGLFLATAILLLKGGEVVGPNLGLLGQFLKAYRVSWTGAFVGFGEGGLLGFGFGWVMAKLINVVVALHQRSVMRKLELGVAFELTTGD
jgi:hypothetical protein